MSNVNNIILRMNLTKIKNTRDDEKLNKQNRSKTCNCSKEMVCPLNGECQVESVVYQAKVKTNVEEKSYIGLTETPFKSRWNEHNFDFRHKHRKTSSELSEYIWR